MSTICFYAQFTASKVGVNSLTVTWDIERITRTDGTRLALVTGGANSVTIGRRGLYGYVLAGADLTLYDYVTTAITADLTVDQKEVAAIWTEWIIPSVPQSADQTAAGVNAVLSAAHGAGSWGGAGGSGATAWTITIKNSSGIPIDGVEVWISTDMLGANVVASGSTDAFGNVTFMLDPGNYYAWKQLAGYTGANPEAFAVP